MAPKTQKEKAREFLDKLNKARSWTSKEAVLDKHHVTQTKRTIEAVKSVYDKYLHTKNIAYFIKNKE